MTFKKSVFFLISILIYTMSYAQDLHFTQFYASPLHLNPANTGNHAGDWRIINNFRDQWLAIGGIPFRSFNLDFDQPFYLGKHRISAGAMIMSDQSGDGKLNKTRLYLSGAYQKKIDGHVLNFGIQPGYIKSTFDNAALTGDQNYDPSIGSHSTEYGGVDGTVGSQTSNFDLNLGITWSKKLGNITPNGGIAVQHILSPKETLVKSDSANLAFRQIYHAGARIELNKIYVQPNLFYSFQNAASEMMLHSNVGYYVAKNPYKIEAVFAGLMYRHGITRNNDAGAIVLGINFKNLDIGISYDINISDLKKATTFRGGYEISIIYTAPSTLLKKVTIPCDRL